MERLHTIIKIVRNDLEELIEIYYRESFEKLGIEKDEEFNYQDLIIGSIITIYDKKYLIEDISFTLYNFIDVVNTPPKDEYSIPTQNSRLNVVVRELN